MTSPPAMVPRFHQTSLLMVLLIDLTEPSIIVQTTTPGCRLEAAAAVPLAQLFVVAQLGPLGCMTWLYRLLGALAMNQIDPVASLGTSVAVAGLAARHAA